MKNAQYPFPPESGARRAEREVPSGQAAAEGTFLSHTILLYDHMVSQRVNSTRNTTAAARNASPTWSRKA